MLSERQIVDGLNALAETLEEMVRDLREQQESERPESKRENLRLIEGEKD